MPKQNQNQKTKTSNFTFKLPPPPPEIFINQDYKRVTEGKGSFNKLKVIERVRVGKEEGVLVYFKGVEHPYKGYPFPAAVDNLATVKRAIRSFSKLLLGTPLILGLPFLIFFLKKIKGIISEFTSVLLSKYYLKPEYYCKSVKELYRVLIPYCKTKPEIHLLYAFCMIFEFDNAYRYRMQDIVSLLDKKKFKSNPWKEIKRLREIACEREIKHVAIHKTVKVFSRLAMLLLIVKKRRIQKVVAELDFKKIAFDDADVYYISKRDDYNYQGISYEERIRCNNSTS